MGAKANARPRYAAATPADRQELNNLIEQKKAFEEQARSIENANRAYVGLFEQPGPTHRLNRGEALAPREVVAPGAIAALLPALDLPLDVPERQRRIALANWIANPANPLTARVIVNRLWHHHFGRGLVSTPSDFGHMGSLPTHPELLDFLAARLIQNGWKLKSIHRLIVLSATYRQASESDSAAREVDADDALLWRFPPRRLEAEAIRDSILAVSGKLDLAMGGPGFDLFEPNANYVRVYEPKETFTPVEFRRMIYAKKPRMHPDAVFAAFDCPDGAQTQPRRMVSTTPLQALNLLNSPFVLDQSAIFAERLKHEARDDMGRQVTYGFLLALGRGPTPAERNGAVELIQGHGLAAFCRALYNANEFVYVQ